MHNIKRLAATFSLTVLAACGGGDDSAPPAVGGGGGGGGGATLTCDTSLFQAGASVAAPTSGQLGPYAGTYLGDEGSFGPNPGDPFVKNGTANFVLSAAGAVTYNAAAMTRQSICLESNAGIEQLVVHFASATGNGHVDLAAAAQGSGMTGVSPASSGPNFVVIQNGTKQ
jgi:hypothetical protein